MDEIEKDYRARLSPKNADAKKILLGNTADVNPNNILLPLQQTVETTGGLIFPFTPTILFSGTAEYDQYGFTHSNYGLPSYIKSAPTEIQLTADFISQTESEAKYTVACLHFLNVVTKSYFGAQGDSSSSQTKGLNGTPPPILSFDYLGDFMFKNIPVVVTNYAFTLEPTTDYVKVSHGDDNSFTYVPSQMTITITLLISYNTRVTREKFDLDKFREGAYTGRGGRRGGFI